MPKRHDKPALRQSKAKPVRPRVAVSPRAAAKATPKPPARAMPKPASKANAKAASKVAAKSTVKTAPKANPKPNPKQAAKALSRVTPKSTAKGATKVSAKAVSKPASKASPKAQPKNTPKPAATAGNQTAGLWPALTAGLAMAGDARAVATSLFTAAEQSDASGLIPHLAQVLGAQFARSTVAARRQAARPEAGAAAIDAAREILHVLQVYMAAVDVVRARRDAIGEACAGLGQPARKKFQTDLGRLALVVTQERTTADVPALMTAAIERVIGEAA